MSSANPDNITDPRYRSPVSLWTAQRLDIAVKLLYARQYLGQIAEPEGIATRELYRRHILQRTGGREPGSDTKISLDQYELEFRQLIDSIQVQGFQADNPIPVHDDGRILNGAHRIAASIALNIAMVPTIVVKNEQAYDWGMRWFLQQDFTPHEINTLLRCWLEARQETAGVIIFQTHPAQWPRLTAKIADITPLAAWRDIWLSEQSLAELQLSGIEPPASGQHAGNMVWRVHWLDAEMQTRQQIVAQIQATAVDATYNKTAAQTESLIKLLLDECRLTLQRQQQVRARGSGIDQWLQQGSCPA